MPELLEREPKSGSSHAVVPRTGAGSSASDGRRAPVGLRPARADLRRQIASLEGQLAELFASTFPRLGIEWKVGAAGGPRVLGIAELESIRDALSDRLFGARAEIARRAEVEESNRALVERMIADPAEHQWVRVSADDVGERSCKHWHSRPRWGLLGMLVGWWRVKLSSGCPLACGSCRKRDPPRRSPRPPWRTDGFLEVP